MITAQQAVGWVAKDVEEESSDASNIGHNMQIGIL